MPSHSYDAAELALSLLAEMPPHERAEFLTDQLVKITDISVLTAARNRLTDAVRELIDEQFAEDR